MNQITFQQYRSIDLTIFTIVLTVFEAITTIATTTWFAAQPVAISISLAIICVVMMRWGWRAVFPAVAGGAVFCIASGATIEQYLIYCIGNVFALLAKAYAVCSCCICRHGARTVDGVACIRRRRHGTFGIFDDGYYLAFVCGSHSSYFKKYRWND